MAQPVLYRKRIIPEECILLKDDKILRYDNDILVTKWNTLKPKKDLHHGFSCYYLKEGYKVSKFYREDNSLLYYYCDIISPEYDPEKNTLVVTDLLADVIVYPDGFVKVVDLDEMVPALESGALSDVMLKQALLSCNALLSLIYDAKLYKLLAPIAEFEMADNRE
ncbi:MAG: DUF402 domain-containing protein [Clostridiales bacterium]|nr:DUF402 domain-containing protein [Clostridiales bacterium]